MTALYLLAGEYRAAAEYLADLDLPPEVVRDTLDGMSGELEAKAQAVGQMVRSIEANAAAMQAWAKQAQDRAKAAQARADSLREYLGSAMQACGIHRIDGPGIALSFRASSAVAIDEPDMIPAEYMRQPPPVPDKKAIADAIKGGADVPGARIETRQNLQIK